MTSRERILAVINHQQPDRVPVDMSATPCLGISAIEYSNLVRYLGKTFFQYHFMKYIDGNVKNSEGHKLLENGNGKNIPKAPSQPGYGKEWERIMIQ